MCFRTMPRHIMNTIRIHPRTGKVCHIDTFSGREAILLQYLSTIFRNIKKKLIMTATVIRRSHQRSSDGCVVYAFIPLKEIITPGIPQIAAAITYKIFFFIRLKILDQFQHFIHSSFNMSSSIFSGFVTGAYLSTTSPSLETRNFVKFHLMSSPKKPPFCFLRYSNSGSASLPFTSILAKSGNVVLYFRVQNSCISSSVPGA